MPVNFRFLAASIAWAILTTSSVVVTPPAACATVDFHEAFQFGAMLPRRDRQIGHVVDVIDTDDGARTQLGQLRQPVDLERIAHLVGHQNVLDAATGKHLGLGNFLTTHTDGTAQAFLQLGHIDRLVASCHAPGGASRAPWHNRPSS